MNLKELKTTDFKENQKYDFIFPIGATEQHGPFIPLGTDTYIVDYLIRQVLKEFKEIIVLPTLEVSRSQEHRGFYGTLWLREETLTAVMSDICNSLKDKARNIFIMSFHANELYINDFIEKNKFDSVNIIHLKICNNEDDKLIEKIINGPLDDHAGNTEISSMLAINEELVDIPSKDYPKKVVENPFWTDNLIEKCPSGIADNHLNWNISKEKGEEILKIYLERVVRNLKKYL